jgi:hypothetical protein
MLSGQQVLREIEQATAAVRSQESDCARLLQGADQDLARQRAARADLLRQLAVVRLGAMQSEKIAAELASAEQRALQLIASGKASFDALSARVEEAQAKRLAAENDRAASADEVARVLTQLEELQANVEPKVRGSAEWIRQKEITDRAEDIHQAADAKADRAEADRAAKGKPYNDDPLFKYLWERKFGTSEYKSGFFVRFFDEKIARLVGYQGARANYAMLNEIPLRLRAHEERCRALFEAERQKLQQIEKEGLQAAGVEPLEQKLATAQAALVEADARLKAADANLLALDKERDRVLKTDNQSAYAQAIEILADADSRETIGRLYDKASRTMTPEDDAIVRQIEAKNNSIATADRQRADLIAKARALSQRRSEIEAQRAQFYRRGYDSPMGQFSNDQAISNVLGGILQGAIQGAVLGQVLQGGFSERGRRADSGFGGGSGFNFPGGGGWIGGSGGGFGGGGGGGFGGGGGGFGGGGGGLGGGGDGFRTGGGF